MMPSNFLKGSFFSFGLLLLLLFSSSTVFSNTFKIVVSTNSILNDSILISINKNTSDKDFISIMERLNKSNFEASFTDVVRNESKEITSISITITKDGSATNYSTMSSSAIDTIEINIENDAVQISNKGMIQFGFANHTDEITKMLQRQKQLFKQFESEEQMEVFKEMARKQSELFANFDFDELEDAFEKVIPKAVLLLGEKVAKIEEQCDDIDSENTALESDTDYNYTKSIKTTYIVNGKELTKKEYDKFDKSKIKSLQIKEEVVKSYNKKE